MAASDTCACSIVRLPSAGRPQMQFPVQALVATGLIVRAEFPDFNHDEEEFPMAEDSY